MEQLKTTNALQYYNMYYQNQSVDKENIKYDTNLMLQKEVYLMNKTLSKQGGVANNTSKQSHSKVESSKVRISLTAKFNSQLYYR